MTFLFGVFITCIVYCFLFGVGVFVVLLHFLRYNDFVDSDDYSPVTAVPDYSGVVEDACVLLDDSPAVHAVRNIRKRRRIDVVDVSGRDKYNRLASLWGIK